MPGVASYDALELVQPAIMALREAIWEGLLLNVDVAERRIDKDRATAVLLLAEAITHGG